MDPTILWILSAAVDPKILWILQYYGPYHIMDPVSCGRSIHYVTTKSDLRSSLLE